MIGRRREEYQQVPVAGGFYEIALTAQAPSANFPVAAGNLPEGEILAIVHYEGGPFRFQIHGGTPTATSGWLARDGETDDLNRHEIELWKACLDTAGSAGTIRVGLFRRRA